MLFNLTCNYLSIAPAKNIKIFSTNSNVTLLNKSIRYNYLSCLYDIKQPATISFNSFGKHKISCTHDNLNKISMIVGGIHTTQSTSLNQSSSITQSTSLNQPTSNPTIQLSTNIPNLANILTFNRIYYCIYFLIFLSFVPMKYY